ncbi:MAG: hypothetical protein WAU24_08365 [Chitinophagaceae bacterium]
MKGNFSSTGKYDFSILVINPSCTKTVAGEMLSVKASTKFPYNEKEVSRF